MVVNQGDIYWVSSQDPSGTKQGYSHPHVVIQENVINHSQSETVILCALTTNRKRANWPGNVLLDVGEANLSRQSVVVVSQVSTVDKTELGQYIGSLSQPRIDQVLAGMQFVQRMREHHETGEVGSS